MEATGKNDINSKPSRALGIYMVDSLLGKYNYHL